MTSKNNSLQIPVLALVLLLAARAAAAHTTAVVEGAAVTTVTPNDGSTSYNTTGIAIGRYLYIYVQGGGAYAGSCKNSGDQIIAYRAPLNNGVPGKFSRVGRISPCMTAPVQESTSRAGWVKASFGPGQVFEAKVRGVTRYHLLADASDWVTFRNIWHATSPDGVNWTWEITGDVEVIPTGQVVAGVNASNAESVADPGDAVGRTIKTTIVPHSFLHVPASNPNVLILNPVMLSENPRRNNARWWGFLNNINYGTGGFGFAVSQMLVDWSAGEPTIQILTGPDYAYSTLADGEVNVSPYELIQNFGSKSLLYDKPSASYQLWGAGGGIPRSASDVDCNTSQTVTCPYAQGCLTGGGTVVPQGQSANAFQLNTANEKEGSQISWITVSTTSFGSSVPLGMGPGGRHEPSGYGEGRMFPFRWNSPNGTRYLFSATNDENICSRFLYSSWAAMYVVMTTVSGPERPAAKLAGPGCSIITVESNVPTNWLIGGQQEDRKYIPSPGYPELTGNGAARQDSSGNRLPAGTYGIMIPAAINGGKDPSIRVNDQPIVLGTQASGRCGPQTGGELRFAIKYNKAN